MTEHDQIRDLLGAYALDAVEGAERLQIEGHLATCGECRNEVDQHRAVAALLASVEEPAPVGLWDKVQAGIEADPGRTVVPLRRARRFQPWLTAVAVVSLVALLGFQTARLSALDDELGDTEAQLLAAEAQLGSTQADLAENQTQLAELEASFAGADYQQIAVLAQDVPGSETVALAGDAGESTVVLLPDGSGILLSSTLRPVETDETYQLWAVIDGEVISAAIVDATQGAVPFTVDPDLLEGLVLTTEVAGGVAVSEQPPAAAWFAEA